MKSAKSCLMIGVAYSFALVVW